MGEKLTQIKKYLKSKNKFILQDPLSFEQKLAITLSKRNTIFVGLALFLIIGTLFYLIISFTSLKNLIPGFPKNASELYELDKENQNNAILLEQKSNSRDKWITNLQNILNNKDSISLKEVGELINSDSTINYKEIVFERSLEDSILRKKLENENLVGPDKVIRTILRDVLNYKNPHDGEVSSFEKAGIKETLFKTKFKSVVKSSMDGIVVSKSNNSIVIQHPHNLISAYYNLEDIKPKLGTELDQGEKIGIIRDSVLRYQIWYKGKTLPSSAYSGL